MTENTPPNRRRDHEDADHLHDPTAYAVASRPGTALAGGDRPLVVREPGDLVAFVPFTLGFVPDSSVVMLTFDARGSSFHARLDLPGREECDEAVDTLLDPALRHGIERVVFVAYGEPEPCEEVGWRLRDAFLDAGIEVMEVLHVADGTWRTLVPGVSGADAGTVDLDSHRFLAQAVVEGRVTHASREALRATVEADPGRVLDETILAAGPLLPARELAALVDRCLEDGVPLADTDLGRVARSLAVPSRRDGVWARLDRGGAAAAVHLWRDAAARLPDRLAPDVCAVLGFVAWLAGDGALAWCAVDRCHRTEPGHSLARVVVQLLSSAAHPDQWARWQPEVLQPRGPAA